MPGIEVTTDAVVGEDPHRTWVAAHREVVDYAFEVFMKSGEWPRVAVARRHFARLHRDVDVQAVADGKPRRSGELRQLHEESLRLSIRELRYMPYADPLIQICLVIARQAASVYRALDDDALQVTSDDAVVVSASGRNQTLVARAGTLLLDHEHPGPIGGGGMSPDGWTLRINETIVLNFEKVMSAADFVAAQDAVLQRDEQTRRATWPAANLPAPAKVFVLMPFVTDWSQPVYNAIRASISDWPSGTPPRIIRADELTRTGLITDQIMEEIQSADVIIADITGLNGNVMWELGYAHAHGKPAIILNQDLDASPFDVNHHRQLSYDCASAMDLTDRLAPFLLTALGIGAAL